jgi:16S rRNA (uracil1498-N3)-methyltransferase
LGKAASKRLSRWIRIVREASEQSRRARLPEVVQTISLAAALETAADHRYVLEEQTAPPFLLALPAQRAPEDRVALLVGPEGGWTDRERETISASGWTAVSLGREILRADTAVIAALAVLNAAWAAR